MSYVGVTNRTEFYNQDSGSMQIPGNNTTNQNVFLLDLNVDWIPIGVYRGDTGRGVRMVWCTGLC